MKKIILSILLTVSMVIGLISVNAVSIEFDDISEEQEADSNIYFEEIEPESEITNNKTDNENEFINIEESKTEEIIQNEEETPLKATDIYNLNYFPSVMMEMPVLDNTNSEIGMLNELEVQPLANNIPIMTLSNSTVIDCTDLFTGEEISHNCNKYLKTIFDNSQHWQQCSICNKIIGNKINHNYSEYWTMGNTCHSLNKLVHSCSCGYSYQTNNTRQHGTLLWSYDGNRHYGQICNICHEMIIKRDETHIDANGNELGCRTGRTGICAICGVGANIIHTGDVLIYEKTNKWIEQKCRNCGIQIYDLSKSSYSVTHNDNYFRFTGVFYFSGNSVINDISTPAVSADSKIIIDNVTQYKGTNNFSVIIDGHYSDKVETSQAIGMSFGGTKGNSYFSGASYVYIVPDIVAPTITNINGENLAYSNGWVTNKKITISGTENYCNRIKLSMKDSNGNIYLNNVSVPVLNKNWSYSFYPAIEADETGLEFTITATDTLENTAIQNFIEYKTDMKPPTVISSQETTKEWSKNKNITVNAIDFGSKNVSIGFNDINKCQLAEQHNNNFLVPYTLTGDVYGSTVAAIYAKDGLENTTTQFVTIYNLDNTAPTITNAISERQGTRNATVTVTANDINTKLNASGSGVTGYAITQEKSVPNESEFQSSNTFNVTKSGTWYVWTKDAVGNISKPVAVDVKIEYTVSLNPNGGVLAGDSTYQIISGETITIPEPTRTGYIFTGWTVQGGESSINGNQFTMGSEDAEITAQWKINKYPVIYIDKNSNGNELGRTAKQIDYNSSVRGSDLGNSTADNAYYNQYRYVSDTSATVSTSGATVYRVFESCETEATSDLQWNDNNNSDGFRPDKYKLKLKRNGTVIDEVELPSNTTTYTFPNLQKYDVNGNPYQYTFDVDATERYKINFDEEGNLIVEDYQPANFSVVIPKTIVLDGRTGNADYTVSVNGTFYYNDTLTVIPESSFTLTDRSKISSMQATVSQQKTGFTKEDGVASGTTANGSIQVNRIYFSGSWQGNFNFDIKFKMQN